MEKIWIGVIVSASWTFCLTLAARWYGRRPSNPGHERQKLIQRINRTPLDRHWKLAAKRGLRRSFVDELIDRITGNVQPR